VPLLPLQALRCRPPFYRDTLPLIPLAREHRVSSDDFETAEIKTSDNTIFIRRYGKGSPLLMVHGFPRTSLMWRYMAPQLAANHAVICADLRGYGRSGVPASTEDHYPYTKRAMANELVDVMDKLGFSKFDVVGHDRGGRVAYRLALDHPEKVRRLAVFDVIPISEGWARMDGGAFGQLGVLTNVGNVILALHLFVGHTHACLPFCH
jgi:haloacetate dehalogenase